MLSVTNLLCDHRVGNEQLRYGHARGSKDRGGVCEGGGGGGEDPACCLSDDEIAGKISKYALAFAEI